MCFGSFFRTLAVNSVWVFLYAWHSFSVACFSTFVATDHVRYMTLGCAGGSVWSNLIIFLCVSALWEWIMHSLWFYVAAWVSVFKIRQWMVITKTVAKPQCYLTLRLDLILLLDGAVQICHHLIYPLTTRVVGAPQMILQPVYYNITVCIPCRFCSNTINVKKKKWFWHSHLLCLNKGVPTVFLLVSNW